MANPKNVIYANTDQLDKMVDLLKGYPKSANKVMNRVLKRAFNSVKTEMGRHIPNVFDIPKKEVLGSLNNGRRELVNTVGANGEGSISVSVIGSPLTITRFKHSPNSPPATRRQYQARVTIYRDRGVKQLKPIFGEDNKMKPVFIGYTKAKSADMIQHIFFHRTGILNQKKKEKIKAIRTLSVPQMVVNPKVAEPLIKGVNEVISKRIEHELNWEFGNLGSNLSKVR